MNTMLDKVAVAGDITQALDRRGVWTCAITVIGGTSSTAVKVQSCDTADGTFEDFKILIPASEASTTQYKGFVVDLHGAKKFIKVVGATMATAVFGDCDHDIKDVAIKAGEVPSSADLEDNKTATINVSEYTEPVEITPSEGKDGMKKATVTLSNIPSPSGVTTLYCWDSGFDTCCYTTTETPTTSDKALLPRTDAINLVSIVSVTEEGISLQNVADVFNRYSTGDISLS